jgi:hypothetical protein
LRLLGVAVLGLLSLCSAGHTRANDVAVHDGNLIDVSLGTGGQGGVGVSANDGIFDEVWACNSATTMTATGGWGCYYLWNTTTNYATGTLKISAPATFVGTYAEAELERLPGLYPLSNYTSTSAWWWAYDSGSNEHQLSTDTDGTFTMVNNSYTVVLTSAATTADAVTTWTFYQAE